MKSTTHFLVLLLISAILPQSFAQGLQLYGLSKDSTSTFEDPFSLVKVDPFSGQTTFLYDLPDLVGVALGSSTYDHRDSRYICWGIDSNNVQRYFSASIDTAAWLSPLMQGGRPIELQYDLQADTTYGLRWDQASQTEYLVTVDLTLGTSTDVAALPGVQGILVGNSAVNSNNHHYFFIGRDGSQQEYLYEVEVPTGNILTQTLLTEGGYFRSLQYDLTSNQLYALWVRIDSMNPSYAETFVATLDISTGQVSLVDSMPILAGTQTGIQMGSMDFDQLTRTLVMVAKDDTSDFQLMLIDVSTGQLTSKVPFPDFMAELECDNQIFARQAYGSSTTIEREVLLTFTAFPNPTTDQIQIRVPTWTADMTWQLLSLQGQVLAQAVMLSEEATVSVKDQPQGIYLLRLRNSAGQQHQTLIQRR